MLRSDPRPILQFDLSQAGLEKMGMASNKALFCILEVCRTQLGLTVLKSGTHRYQLSSPTPEFPTGVVEFEIHNCQFIVFRRCQGDLSDFRYDIIAATNIGSGAFGVIYDEIATLVPHQDKYFNPKNLIRPNNIYKISSRNHFFNHDIIRQKMAHLHLKPLQFFIDEGGKQLTLQRMRKIYGANIHRYITINPRTQLELLLCALFSLEAIYYQLARHHLVHCDIKMENIIYNIAGAKIIDIDFLRQEQAKKPLLAGTHGYFAPEYITSYIPSLKSDVYAAGLMLAEIFYGKNTFYSNSSNTKITTDEHANLIGIDKKVTGLFDGLPLMPDNIKKDIRELLDRMTHPDSNMRPTIRQAIDVISNAIYELFVSTSTANSVELKKALSTASELVEKMNSSNLPDVLNYITYILPILISGFSDHPNCIKLFKIRANIDAFSSAQSKMDIINIAAKVAKKYHQATLDFESNYSRLMALKANYAFAEKSSNALFSHIDEKLRIRDTKYVKSVDSIILLTTKLQKETRKLENQIQVIIDKRTDKLYQPRPTSPTIFQHIVVANTDGESAYAGNRVDNSPHDQSQRDAQNPSATLFSADDAHYTQKRNNVPDSTSASDVAAYRSNRV